ncbi:hypothetical protein Salat_2794700 [Sesamum alatum]|uniref:Uncharacterized protein n=1 Tax=Sesamum alatum TaxID=300844 RepID=A0AAE1XLU8_9LAMI|nr:hypothetical protein Salat_2794700 [Sesamum alatum]
MSHFCDVGLAITSGGGAETNGAKTVPGAMETVVSHEWMGLPNGSQAYTIADRGMRCSVVMDARDGLLGTKAYSEIPSIPTTTTASPMHPGLSLGPLCPMHSPKISFFIGSKRQNKWPTHFF